MTKEELMERIYNLETAKFYLAMKDRWSLSDFNYDDDLDRDIRKATKEFFEAGGTKEEYAEYSKMRDK